MLIEYLSDYAGDELKSSKQERLRASYDEGIWQTQYREAEAEYRAARRNRPLVTVAAMRGQVRIKALVTGSTF